MQVASVQAAANQAYARMPEPPARRGTTHRLMVVSAGAGSIRACHRAGVPAVVLTRWFVRTVWQACEAGRRTRTPPSAWREVCERNRQALELAPGEVSNSSRRKNSIACSRVVPHISNDGCNPEHTAGRSACPKSRQRRSASRCGQGIPAGLPFGRPGMRLLMDGSMQQAAQPGRQPSGSIPGLGEGAGMAGIVTQNGGIK